KRPTARPEQRGRAGGRGGTPFSESGRLQRRDGGLALLGSGNRPPVDGWELVVGSTVQLASGDPFSHPAPLLEEKWHVPGAALAPDRPDPALVHRARPGAALTADDDPADAGEVEWPE